MGAITDFRDIRFAKVSRSNDNDDIKYEASVIPLVNENQYLLHYLTKYFTVDASKFGYYRLNLLPNNIRIHNKLLGTGANSMVLNCFFNNDQSNEYALKISNKIVDKEVSIYKQLYQHKWLSSIMIIYQFKVLFKIQMNTLFN